jgi:hypothetical protein
MSALNHLLNTPLKRRAALYVCSFAAGILAGHGNLYLLPAAFLFVALIPLASTRGERWFVPMGYYGAFLITMFPGASIFFGHSFNPIAITLLWLVIALILSAPWALLCNSDPRRLLWAVPLCLSIESIPPIGLFAVGNPLSSAGVLLPHTGWIGLAVVLLFSSFTATRPKIALPVVALLTVLSTFVSHATPKPPTSWVAINTTLGGQGQEAANILRDYQEAQYIQRTALQTPARVVIFPEALLVWNAATEDFWSDTLQKLDAAHKTMILGATIRLPGRAANYRNVAVLRGETNTVFDQRIPIPVTMWNPLSRKSVPMHLYGPGTINNVAGERPAVLICYEQLLVWPIARSMTEHPTVLVGIANDYWAAHTYFPAIQTANLEAWARLFNLPVITAVNQ